MLLAVDIGNTNVVFGLYDGTTLTRTFRVSTVRTRTADEYGVLLHQMMTLHGLPPGRVEAAIVASVVPPLTDVMSDAIRHAFAREPLVVGPGVKTGISVLYDNPRDVGADRIVNAVAAFERFRAAVIVVDFGTATTFDCVSAKAEYLGGIWCDSTAFAEGTDFSDIQVHGRLWIRRARLGTAPLAADRFTLSFGYTYA